ncbi:restriction endonuclease subunit S [Legionella quinlivanii]|uniref:restriction endonuclease subunit S n=1 Tax=Legionella quinlivanii TaxID=45073 RepID=UPI000DD49644|nr:restriction endonuclease subunit S [Legionella quinlivanii]
MIRKLEQVTTIISGAGSNAYTNLENPDIQPFHLMRGNDLDQNGHISLHSMEQVYLSSSQKTGRYILESEDVVVLARGSAIRVGFITKEIADAGVIASANFIILRPKKAQVQGEVITAYLNSEIGREHLLKLSKGAVIQHIPTSNLKSMEIPVPNLQIQNKIREIFYATQLAYQATLDLAEQQKRTANALILDLMQEAA